MTAIHEAAEVTDELIDAMGLLLRQLSSSSPPPTRAAIEAIVASPASRLLIARDGESGQGAVIGTLTVVIFPIPTGVRAWIEDVVVDQSARGRGVGEALCRRAIELAAAAGAKTVDLTSRPSRAAANRLYRRLGFQGRDSTVYRYQPGDGADGGRSESSGPRCDSERLDPG